MGSLTSILLAALGIGFLIFIHEFGHFLCARLAGVRVEVFSLGFGQRILGFVWRGTDYRLSLVPLGGYVRVAGEDPTQRHGLGPDDLYAKSLGARALFFSGGVVMNLLFALIAFPILFKSGVHFNSPVIGSVIPGGVAWEAGLEPGDRVRSADGKTMYSFDNLQVEVALAARSGIELEIERQGHILTVPLVPRFSDRMGLYELGVSPTIVDEPRPIDTVDPNSPAYQIGLRRGDVIVGVNGERLTGAESDAALRDALEETGTTLSLLIDRDGTEQTFAFVPDRSTTPKIGVRPAQRTVIGLRSGCALVERLGLERGDEVIGVDGAPYVGGLDAFTAGTGDILVRVLRDGDAVQLTGTATRAERDAFAEHVAFGPAFRDDPDRGIDGVVIVPTPDSPATRVGILPGDRVVAIAGDPIHSWNDLVDAVSDAGTDPLAIRIERVDGTIDLELVPAPLNVAAPGFATRLRFQKDLFQVESVGGAIEAGMVASLDLIKQLYVTLKRLFTGEVAARNLGGIIQISRVSYRFAQLGWAEFVYFLALLSINLAFINVLPIPVLDGGHLLFLLIEKIKGSPPSAQVINYGQIIGLVFVIALMVFVTYNDILKLL